MESKKPQRKKRAPQCKELDNPLIRKEIEFRYGIEGWKLDAVVEEINKAYGLNATKIQYRERLNKWGCRQRLNHKEYQRVHQTVSARQALKKESKIFLNNTTEIPEKRLQRWIARNTTFTSQLFSKAGIPTPNLDMQASSRTLSRPGPYGLVRTPSPNPETYLLPIIKKSVSIYYPHTPIGQLQGYLRQILPKNVLHPEDGSSALSTHFSTPNLPLLGTIIYRISNKMVYLPSGYYLLLDQVDRHDFRMHLRKLLSISSPSILATCSALLPSLYFRKDDEMFNYIIANYPQLNRRLYCYLKEYIKSEGDIPKTPTGRVLKDILREISNVRLSPESAEEAHTLLFACKHSPEDFAIFCRLWDRNKVSAQELDSYLTPPLGRHGLIGMPLFSRSPAQLKVLLEYGFIRCKFIMLFQVIVLNDQNLMRILCENLGIKHKASITHPSTGPKGLWELLDEATFYDIVSKCTTEIATERRRPRKINGFGIDPEIYVLVYAACVQPQFTQYVVEIIQWKYSISAEQAARIAINAMPILQDYGLVAPFDLAPFPPDSLKHTDLNRVSVLGALLHFGVDPNETSFWRTSFWEEVGKPSMAGQHKVHHSVHVDTQIPGEVIETDRYQPAQATTQVFRLLLDSGADVNGQLEINILDIIQDYMNPSSSYLDRETIEFMEYFDFQEMDTPIEIAFGFEDSYAFCFLIERSASVHRLYRRFTSGKYRGVHPGFVQAIQERNLNTIEDLWNQRILNLAVISALERGNVDAARDIILAYNHELRLNSLFLGVGELYCSGRLSYADCYDLLGLMLEMSASLGSNIDPSSHTQDGRGDPLQLATLDCLQLLISQGSSIDETSISIGVSNSDAMFYMTALSGAISGGNIETVAYVIKEGANVYAPCGFASSAIEFAISERRIDSLALILEAVPNSYPLAVAAVEDRRYKDEYIAEYVRTWKPADLSTDGEGKIIDITGEDLEQEANLLFVN
ncbi:uncharacterized protein DFL_000695 [Arthrobotrys flagrans]|uniref:Clr5 domain-containing protein n=1 Tax=Arthrobotrys flagrans TaxID=97331 RepID=A0A437AFJ0_ARTFL|nr:hypothetical protein DFL_000695 [Arthrobotrys flagrans]